MGHSHPQSKRSHVPETRPPAGGGQREAEMPAAPLPTTQSPYAGKEEPALHWRSHLSPLSDTRTLRLNSPASASHMTRTGQSPKSMGLGSKTPERAGIWWKPARQAQGPTRLGALSSPHRARQPEEGTSAEATRGSGRLLNIGAVTPTARPASRRFQHNTSQQGGPSRGPTASCPGTSLGPAATERRGKQRQSPLSRGVQFNAGEGLS